MMVEKDFLYSNLNSCKNKIYMNYTNGILNIGFFGYEIFAELIYYNFFNLNCFCYLLYLFVTKHYLL